MNVIENAGAPAAPPSGNTTVIIQNRFQMEKKSNTTSIVIINVVCWCVVAPIVVFVALVAGAASEIVSNLPEATTAISWSVADPSPGPQVKDICELDGQTFNLTENIILTEPEVNPDEYENNKNCVVTITVPDKQISLEFEHFHVESFLEMSCTDWLKVEDEILCGAPIPVLFEDDYDFKIEKEYSTDMQSLTFQWYTNSDIGERGFRVILKHKDSENAPDFFDNINGLRAHLTNSKTNKEE